MPLNTFHTVQEINETYCDSHPAVPLLTRLRHENNGNQTEEIHKRWLLSHRYHIASSLKTWQRKTLRRQDMPPWHRNRHHIASVKKRRNYRGDKTDMPWLVAGGTVVGTTLRQSWNDETTDRETRHAVAGCRRHGSRHHVRQSAGGTANGHHDASVMKQQKQAGDKTCVVGRHHRAASWNNRKLQRRQTCVVVVGTTLSHQNNETIEETRLAASLSSAPHWVIKTTKP